MTRQKSEDREVPQGRRKPSSPRARSHGDGPQDDHPVPLSRKQGVEGERSGRGKAAPVKEADPQQRLLFATAESPRQQCGAESGSRPDLSERKQQEAPKAKSKPGQVGPARMERVVALLVAAFDKVAANKGAPGPDRQTIDQMEKHLPEILEELRSSLLDESYRPGDIRRVWIPKGGGGQRGLGIPNVVDRVVQEAVRAVLEPLYEPTFHPSSHGFRPYRSCQTAITEARSYTDAGHGWVVDLDLEKFFDRVHHQRLMARLAQRVSDKRLLALVGRMLKAKVVMPDGVKVSTEEGVPQGGPLSPLLSNVVLSELDEELSRRGLRFVRYADDCNIYVRSERAGQRVKASVTEFIRRRLRLTVNEAKSAVARPDTRHFLGYRLHPTPGQPTEITLSERSETRLRERIVELTPRSKGQSLKATILQINAYLYGWLGHFKVCTRLAERVIQTMDAHIRRRLRAFILRQWKTKRTAAKRLISLGVKRSTAWRRVYEGRKSIWALSHDPAVDRGLCNAYFAAQGLVSLRERFSALWASILAPEQRELFGDTARS